MYYSIRHRTRFRYSSSITQSMMEVRMQPRSEGGQRCLRFQLTTSPRAQVLGYRDGVGNAVHHFNIPGSHNQLTITAESLVEILTPPPLPDTLAPAAWAELDTLTSADLHWDYLQPSQFAQPTELLSRFAAELRFERKDDPLTLLRNINTAIYDTFDYVPQSTRVDSPIDDALRERRGVCQDFAHIMIALVRTVGIPCRYVSGYLFHRTEAHDRSSEDATHAWVEALLPELGWIGFDPTNNLVAAERHIRVAIGRDYADVPPTRGVFKGKTDTELSVGVQVSPSDLPPEDEELLSVTGWVAPTSDDEIQAQQEQQ